MTARVPLRAFVQSNSVDSPGICWSLEAFSHTREAGDVLSPAPEDRPCFVLSDCNLDIGTTARDFHFLLSINVSSRSSPALSAAPLLSFVTYVCRPVCRCGPQIVIVLAAVIGIFFFREVVKGYSWGVTVSAIVNAIQIQILNYVRLRFSNGP